MDYPNLNSWMKKDHFLKLFIDQILDQLADRGLYCFLDKYSEYNQSAIVPDGQEKTTFTCPYGTVSFKRMSFELCNALVTFERCMLSIFTDMVENFVESSQMISWWLMIYLRVS